MEEAGLVRDGEGNVSLGCGHYLSVGAWQAHLQERFCTGRKAPLGALTCPRCARPLSAPAFAALASAPDQADPSLEAIFLYYAFHWVCTSSSR